MITIFALMILLCLGHTLCYLPTNEVAQYDPIDNEYIVSLASCNNLICVEYHSIFYGLFHRIFCILFISFFIYILFPFSFFSYEKIRVL